MAKMCLCGRQIDIPGNICGVCAAKEDVQELRDLAQWLTSHDTQEQPVTPTDEQVTEPDEHYTRYDDYETGETWQAFGRQRKNIWKHRS
jgi:hypothetical protein